MTLRVLLDTNALHDNKWRASEGMRTFSRLCKSGHVQCIVPHVVESEIVSQTVAHQISGLAALHAAFKKLQRFRLPKPDHTALTEALRLVRANEQAILQSASALFGEWCEEIGAVRADLGAEHTRNILSGYFSGGAPFKGIKSREDFPDAFIYEVVKDYCGEALYVICADNGLRKACGKLANVTVLKNMDEFIALPDVKAMIIAESEVPDTVVRVSAVEMKVHLGPKPESAVDYVLALLANAKIGNEVMNTMLVSDVRAELMGESIRSPLLASDDSSGHINVLFIETVDYTAASANYYGDWKFSVLFQMRGTALVQYYHSVDSGLKIRGRSVSTKAVYKDVAEVSAILDLKISGRAVIELDIESVVAKGVVESFRSIKLDEIVEFELSATVDDDDDDDSFTSLQSFS